MVGPVRFKLTAKACSKGLEVKGAMWGSGTFQGIHLKGSGELTLKAGRASKINQQTKGSFRGSASLTASLPGTGLAAKLTVAGKYTTNGATSHRATLSGEVALSLCGHNRNRKRREAIAAFKEANHETTNRHRRWIPFWNEISRGVSTYNTIKYYDERIPNGIMPPCPKTQIGVGLTLSYKDKGFIQLRNRIPHAPNGGKRVKIFATLAGIPQAPIVIQLATGR